MVNPFFKKTQMICLPPLIQDCTYVEKISKTSFQGFPVLSELNTRAAAISSLGMFNPEPMQYRTGIITFIQFHYNKLKGSLRVCLSVCTKGSS